MFVIPQKEMMTKCNRLVQGIGAIILVLAYTLSFLRWAFGHSVYSGPVLSEIGLIVMTCQAVCLMGVMRKELSGVEKPVYSKVEMFFYTAFLIIPYLCVAYRFAVPAAPLSPTPNQMPYNLPVSMVGLMNLALFSGSMGLLLFNRKRSRLNSLIVGVLGLFMISLDIFVLLGHWQNIPILYGFRFTLPATLANLFLAAGILVGTLPLPGLLVPLVSRQKMFRLMGCCALLIGALLIANGIWMVLRIHDEFSAAHLLPMQLPDLYWNSALANTLLAVLSSATLLELVNAYRENKEATEEIKKHNLELEERVESRMKELQENREHLEATDEELQEVTLELAEKNQVLEYALDGISQLDIEGRYVNVNDAYAAITGYSPHEIVGKHWSETVAPDEVDRLSRLYSEMLENGKVQTEAQGVKKGGKRFFKEMVMIPKIDERGNLAGHYCFMKDISERKALEQNLNKTISDLQEMKQLFSLTGDVICITDFNGIFLTVNPALLNALGYAIDEVEGKCYLDFLHPDDKGRTDAEFQKILSTGWSDYFENRYRCSDGTYRWFSWTSTSDMSAKRVYAVARDCTDRKATEHELKESFKHLQESERRRSTYIAALTHDLRTPLIAQRHVLNLIEDALAGFEDDDIRTLSAGLLTNNQNLLDLVNRLLESYQHEDGKIPFSFESVSISPLVREIMDDVMPLAQQKGIRLQNFIPISIRPVLGDKHHLKRVFQNLIGNALEHLPLNEGIITITAEDKVDKVDVCVSDNGTGIDPELLPSLFERYLMGVNKKRKIGSGLGLYICRLIVERHGGTITVDNKSDGGAAFTLSLPKPPFEELVFEGTGYEREAENA